MAQDGSPRIETYFPVVTRLRPEVGGEKDLDALVVTLTPAVRESHAGTIVAQMEALQEKKRGEATSEKIDAQIQALYSRLERFVNACKDHDELQARRERERLHRDRVSTYPYWGAEPTIQFKTFLQYLYWLDKSEELQNAETQFNALIRTGENNRTEARSLSRTVGELRQYIQVVKDANPWMSQNKELLARVFGATFAECKRHIVDREGVIKKIDDMRIDEYIAVQKGRMADDSLPLSTNN
jgi:hypothetical protein